jgi:hypothetical protein
VDDSDGESGEFRLDWLRTENRGLQSDQATVEIEKGFGELTVELELHGERDADFGSITQGVGNTDVGARYPIVQYVSPSGAIDSTFGVGIEVGIPNDSSVSKNTEVVPKVFNDLRIGDHFTLQSIVGYSTLCGGGGGGDAGLQNLEYGFVFGWAIQHKELPLPGVEQLIPVFELSGTKQLNHDDVGHDSLDGNIAIRVNLKAIGRIQPRLGFGYVFPIDKGGREDLQRGFYTSLVFEF